MYHVWYANKDHILVGKVGAQFWNLFLFFLLQWIAFFGSIYIYNLESSSRIKEWLLLLMTQLSKICLQLLKWHVMIGMQ